MSCLGVWRGEGRGREVKGLSVYECTFVACCVVGLCWGGEGFVGVRVYFCCVWCGVFVLGVFVRGECTCLCVCVFSREGLA